MFETFFISVLIIWQEIIFPFTAPFSQRNFFSTNEFEIVDAERETKRKSNFSDCGILRSVSISVAWVDVSVPAKSLWPSFSRTLLFYDHKSQDFRVQEPCGNGESAFISRLPVRTWPLHVWIYIRLICCIITAYQIHDISTDIYHRFVFIILFLLYEIIP